MFGPPNRPVDTAEYLIALHVTALIKDGGTIQIGIGALEDAVTYLLEIADSRFQEDLVDIAKRAGKLRKGYSTPDYARHNRPERLEKLLASYRERGLFPLFPFGTDLTAEEQVLHKALLLLKQMSEEHKLRMPHLAELQKTLVIPKQAQPYLARMELNRPKTIRERLMQRALVYALASIQAI